MKVSASSAMPDLIDLQDAPANGYKVGYFNQYGGLVNAINDLNLTYNGSVSSISLGPDTSSAELETLGIDLVHLEPYKGDSVNSISIDTIKWFVSQGGTFSLADPDNAGTNTLTPEIYGGLDYNEENSNSGDFYNLADGGFVNDDFFKIDNATLDQGTATYHGTFNATQLKDNNATLIAHKDGDASAVGAFYYEIGEGDVFVTTIPLNYYLSGQLETGHDDFFKAFIAHQAGLTDLSDLGFRANDGGGVDPIDPVPQPNPPAGKGVFENQVSATGDADSDLIFTTSLTRANGQEVDGFKVRSHGSEVDQSAKYILNVEVTNNSGASLEGVDFTLNFADPLFQEIISNHVSITENLDLANSVAINDGAVRVMAGSAGNLTEGATGINHGSKSTVASFLLDIDDSQFVDGLDGLDTAGIQITANLDQTVFGDLTTLRDRGGSKAFAIGSEDISVVMAEANLDDTTNVNNQMGQDHENGFVLGTVRETGVIDGKHFSNLIRSGATVYKASSNFTNSGDITATDVKLSLNGDSYNLDGDSIELSINGSDQEDFGDDGISLDNIAIDGSITIDYAIKASGGAGSVFNSADIGYEIHAAGGKSFTSTAAYLDTSNLITYKGDLNLDGTVSMLDLAYLNSGALDGAKDTDANFDGKIDMLDLESIDSDWGESLHTGDGEFTGNDSMDWGDLSASDSGATWSDTSFQDQNAIEAGDDFQVLLDLDEMGSVNDLDIESDAFQSNDLANAADNNWE